MQLAGSCCTLSGYPHILALRGIPAGRGPPLQRGALVVDRSLALDGVHSTLVAPPCPLRSQPAGWDRILHHPDGSNEAIRRAALLRSATCTLALPLVVSLLVHTTYFHVIRAGRSVTLHSDTLSSLPLALLNPMDP